MGHFWDADLLSEMLENAQICLGMPGFAEIRWARPFFSGLQAKPSKAEHPQEGIWASVEFLKKRENLLSELFQIGPAGESLAVRFQNQCAWLTRGSA